MSLHQFLAVTRVTVTAPDRDSAAKNLRGLLDDTLARMDAEHPAGSVESSPVTVLDRRELTDTLRAIRSDAEALRAGTTLTRTEPATRIIGRVDQLLALLDSKPADDTPASAETPDPDDVRNLQAALVHAQDLRDNTISGYEHTQVSAWITAAQAALDTRNAAEIRRMRATPLVADPADGWNDPLPGGAL